MSAQLLGEVLIQKGVITKQILDNALELQQHEGGLLGMILLSGGYISEKNLIEALAAQLKDSAESPRSIH
jgi:type IV pilus assembly protein PilB